jgi:hypothetical protein
MSQVVTDFMAVNETFKKLPIETEDSHQVLLLLLLQTTVAMEECYKAIKVKQTYKNLK